MRENLTLLAVRINFSGLLSSTIVTTIIMTVAVTQAKHMYKARNNRFTSLFTLVTKSSQLAMVQPANTIVMKSTTPTYYSKILYSKPYNAIRNKKAFAALANIKVNFQEASTIPPSGWLRDYGQAFGSRTTAYQGSGYIYGWKKISDGTPVDLTKNGRKRSSPPDILLATLMHMQADDISNFNGTPIEGIWEAQVENGNYDVSVSVGDGAYINSRHTINIERVPIIVGFVPTTSTFFKSATITVTVADGALTVDAIGGMSTKINYIIVKPSASLRPSVVSVNPENSLTDVNENSSVSTNVLNLPNSGINNATITSSTVYLSEKVTGASVTASVNGTGGGDAITLVPSALKLSTTYVFTITAGVKDLSGASFIPYHSTFTTSSVPTTINSEVKFEQIKLTNTAGRHSSLTIGPDGKLYALTIDGIIKRFIINADGTLRNPELLHSLQDASGTRQKRLVIGFAFDPLATATNLIAWVTHSSFLFLNAPDWDGKLTKLSGNALQNVKDVLINLPRSCKDHLTNSIAFGPDGALYFPVGSNSAMGKADNTWSLREEHLLSAAVLRLDITKLGTLPLNVKTSEGGGNYNPYAANAPLTIYASGVRNAYDLIWHSNGELYMPTNGSAAGGNTPGSVTGTLRTDGTVYNGPSVPVLINVQQTQKDFLFRVKKGGYYGHPNATRGEYVMNGGNPTSGTDKAQVNAYPSGTLPDINWRGYAFDFQNNKSPNGAIEYKSNSFNGALKGKLLVVRYSQHDDIITLAPGSISKDIASSIEGSSIEGFTGFIDPLDITEDIRTGNIYVSEYGGETGNITLLRPKAGSTFLVQKATNMRDTTLHKELGRKPPYATAYLVQNAPNPFSDNTIIRYRISETVNAQLIIADMKGIIVNTIILTKGSNQVNINSIALAAGTYIYSLWIEGKQVDSKQMVIAR